ncbi:GreA/GreB family elongation factor [Pontibacter mangrovi]|uniref:Transcription elongation factor GreAB n=1 Tax=Pontibacter mangrovi TaxID=2589816 RepID=A0A501WGR2_9BACT|nr:GreA/GreB family elongation factor [Pontibacter mangrovi]TPE46321.1 transcription elongation factor GreAB [Pontibacter mangrovi]
MSRAFTKEDDALEAPIIPPRAALPAGLPNYVTPHGLEQLRAELGELEAERSKAEANHDDAAERTRQITLIKGKIALLTHRITSAKVVDPREQPSDEVRFGATVTLKTISGGKKGMVRTFTIVGVDEASVQDGKIGFVAPIARAVTGKKVGEQAQLQMGRVQETVEITEISYKAS